MIAPSLGRVLIVDDEVELMTALCESLTHQGYQALGRTSAHEALALLQAQDIDLLVCDLMMPEMDGIALLRAALEIDPHLIGIIMTGQGTLQTAVDAMKAGAFDYVRKPCRLHALLPVLARALQMRQLRMENVQLRETVAMYELGQTIAYALDTNTILHTVVDGALQQVNGAEAAIMLPTPEGEDLYIAAIRGKNQETLLGMRVSMTHSVIGWVACHREPLMVPGAVSDLPFVPQHIHADCTTLVLPMLAGGKLLGVLSVSMTRRLRPFTLGQMQALSILTNVAATALEHAALFTQVRQNEERFRAVTEMERKRLETQLRQAQKMQAIGTLAGGIAHDFNNILSAILGYTELALGDVEQGSTVWHDLQGTLTAGRRARDLVQQILAFCRQTERARTSIPLHWLVEEALVLLRAALPSIITIRPIIDRNAGAVLADPTQMQQVLINLCTNAAYAMREAGGVIEVRLEPIEIAADAPAISPELKAGPYVRLTVQDTGHGMEPEILERILEPFFTTKSMGEGTGMGLAVVHSIIANHGGAITVESAPGQGSTFVVYLPRHDSPDTVALPARESMVGGHERILFVDDEAALVHVGRATLQRLGYQVVVCASSSEALETFRTAPGALDLVVTDRTMPVLTGEALVRELRQIRPDIPIILCTGFSHPVTPEQLRALRVDAFLMKPVMAHEWARVIRQVLERRTAEEM
jgi:signal transduction histidine kinase/DNA-binding response OmpR family regulator